MPETKKHLWGGEFWSKGYFISTVGKHGNEDKTVIYIKSQGKPGSGYKVIHYVKQLSIMHENDFL